MKLSYPIGIPILSLVLLLAGCGGGNGSADTTPPTVTVSPDGGAIDPDADISLTFSEAMDQDSVAVSGSLFDAAIAPSWAGNALTLTPAGAWTEKATLSLTITGNDASGNAMTAVTKTFTVNDVTAPTVTQSPEGGINPYGDIVLVFSESMDPDSLEFGSVLGSTDIDAAWSETNVGNDTLTLSPVEYWVGGHHHELQLEVADLGGNTVAVAQDNLYVHLEFEDFQPAIAAIGDTDLVGADHVHDAAPGNGWLSGNVVVHGDRLLMADPERARILVFNEIPVDSGATADAVIGQPDFTTWVTGLGPSGMSDWISALSVDGDRLAVVDYGNNRVLLFTPVPASGETDATLVVGQPDFDSNGFDCTATSLRHPEGAIVVDDKLVVADADHNRVLIWNSIPTENGAPADLVLGQSDFVSCGATNGASGLFYPAAVWTDGERILVANNGSSRILGWNSWPTENGQPADFVLGQQDFDLFEPNDSDGDGVSDGSAAADTLYWPYEGLWSNGTQIVVADTNNNRVLIWHSWPTANGQPADRVLGQGDFVHQNSYDDNQDGAQDGQPSARTMAIPTGVYAHGPYLFLLDNYARTLVFRSNETPAN